MLKVSVPLSSSLIFAFSGTLALACGDWDSSDLAKTATVKKVQECELRGYDFETRDEKNEWRALQYAASFSHPDVVKAMLTSGVAPQSDDDGRWPPILLAVRHGRVESLKHLVNGGAERGHKKS
jgi:hypothetical protein